MSSYREAYEEAKNSPAEFWKRAAADIVWERPFDQVYDDSGSPRYQWFPGGVLNTCYNAIDFHVANGRADQLAVIYDSPVTGVKRTLTYRELLGEVSRFAGVLASLGVVKGDRVVIYMPMIPETLVAMYACARIGAIHSWYSADLRPMSSRFVSRMPSPRRCYPPPAESKDRASSSTSPCSRRRYPSPATNRGAA